MFEFTEILFASPLFEKISPEDVRALFPCLHIKIASFEKNEYIFHAGDCIKSFGMVISGSVHIIKEDYFGNQSILSEISSPGIFGETYACIEIEPLAVSAVAAQAAEVVFIDVNAVLSSCTHACASHTTLVRNFLSFVARKNLMLTAKMELLSQKTTRRKILSYLSEQSRIAGKSTFQIPFNRQQLADYLMVDRSALSNEMCHLRDIGIIRFRKSEFSMLRQQQNADNLS